MRRRRGADTHRIQFGQILALRMVKPQGRLLVAGRYQAEIPGGEALIVIQG